MGITVAPLTTVVMQSVGESRAGAASGVNNAVSRVAGLLAIAMFGSLMAWAFDAQLQASLHAVQLPPELVASVQAQRAKLAAIELPGGTDAASAAAVHRIVGDAFVAGFRWIMALSAGLALAGSAVAAVFVRRDQPRGGAAVD
jgi:hypothetical protein